jgi:hypothetical protein
MVDQNPIGKSSRSNPITYIKAYDEIRDLFASQALSKMRGFQPKHFIKYIEPEGRAQRRGKPGEQNSDHFEDHPFKILWGGFVIPANWQGQFSQLILKTCDTEIRG